MNEVEIKKAMYRQKPKANLTHIRGGVAHYVAQFKDGDVVNDVVNFEVPVADMGDADFFPEMDAKLLARYIKIYE